MGLRCATTLLAALGWASPATAASIDWQLSAFDGTVLGTFTLDFAPPALRNPLIQGFAGTYDIPSRSSGRRTALRARRCRTTC
jgi:hypothetical protein